MRNVTLTTVLLTAALVTGCAADNNEGFDEAYGGDFLLFGDGLGHPMVEMRCTYPAGGHLVWYDISLDGIRVFRDDTLIYDASLTRSQVKTLRDCVAAMRVHKMKRCYEDNGMLDGYYIEFRIQDSPTTMRIIRVKNYEQPDLMRLAACVDLVLPKKFRQHYGKSWEAIEQEADLPDSPQATTEPATNPVPSPQSRP